MNSPLYTIERWPHGWTISAPPDQSGVPLNALSECGALFPKGAMTDNSIAGHLRRHRGIQAVFAVGRGKDLNRWRAEIIAEISHLTPVKRWWSGLDVGTSSASIYSILSTVNFTDARLLGRGSVPHDADDFGRCKRLLDLFPEWRERLPEVASAYPATPWPDLVARWAELEAVHGTAAFQPLLDSLIH